MERILVTGGAGFIGSHLCERLVMEGNDVICVDNSFTGSKDNIRHLLGSDRFEAVRHDVTTPYYAEVVNPNGIRSCYDEGKRAAETLCMDYHRQHGIRVKIIRIFNTYGPRMDKHDGRVVSNFIVQALTGHDITIYGDGSQTRSFQYVDDLIEGMMRMMDTPDDFSGPVNIGNPGEFSMLELAHEVLRLTGSRSKIVFAPLPQDDPKQRKPDISLAYEKLGGWQPTIRLEEGLKKTIAYFDELLSKEGVRATNPM